MGHTSLDTIMKSSTFSMSISIDVVQDMYINILFQDKDKKNCKILKEFSKGTTIEILPRVNPNYDGVDIYMSVNGNQADNFSIPNKFIKYEAAITIGTNIINIGNSSKSLTGHLVTDILLLLSKDTSLVKSINVTIPDFFILKFQKDSVYYHFYNLIFNTVCKTKKIIELAYVFRYDTKVVRVYAGDVYFELKRDDSIIEYTIGENKHYLIKNNNGKHWFMVIDTFELNIVHTIYKSDELVRINVPIKDLINK